MKKEWIFKCISIMGIVMQNSPMTYMNIVQRWTSVCRRCFFKKKLCSLHCLHFASTVVTWTKIAKEKSTMRSHKVGFWKLKKLNLVNKTSLFPNYCESKTKNEDCDEHFLRLHVGKCSACATTTSICGIYACKIILENSSLLPTS